MQLKEAKQTAAAVYLPEKMDTAWMKNIDEPP
jgi:hypothetical protein